MLSLFYFSCCMSVSVPAKICALLTSDQTVSFLSLLMAEAQPESHQMRLLWHSAWQEQRKSGGEQQGLREQRRNLRDGGRREEADMEGRKKDGGRGEEEEMQGEGRTKWMEIGESLFFTQTISLFNQLSYSQVTLCHYLSLLSESPLSCRFFFPVRISNLLSSLLLFLLISSCPLSLLTLYTHLSVSLSASLPSLFLLSCCLYFFSPLPRYFSPRSLSSLSVTSFSALLDPQL